MNYSQISSEYTGGTTATNNLIQMLRAAISATLPKAKVKVTGGFGWRGYGIAQYLLRYTIRGVSSSGI